MTEQASAWAREKAEQCIADDHYGSEDSWMDFYRVTAERIAAALDAARQEGKESERGYISEQLTRFQGCTAENVVLRAQVEVYREAFRALHDAALGVVHSTSCERFVPWFAEHYQALDEATDEFEDLSLALPDHPIPEAEK